MKLNRIKKICMEEGAVRLYSVEAPENNVFQWLGTDNALYAVEGCMLTLSMLKAIWEIDAKKAGNLDMVEDTMQGAVERRQLTQRDALILSTVPGMIDAENAPVLGLVELNGCGAIAYEKSGVLFAPQSRFAPCYGKWHTPVDIYNDEQYRPAWVAVYKDEVISGMIRPLPLGTAERIWELARSVVERKPRGWAEPKGGEACAL